MTKDWKKRWDKNYRVGQAYPTFGNYPVYPTNTWQGMYEEHCFKKCRYPTLSDDVLDLGCGAGNRMEQFIGKVNSATGVDISTIAIDRARNRFKEYPNFYFTDDTDLLALNKKFDFIFSIAVFQHLPREFTREYIQQAFKVLKPNGVLFFNMLSGDCVNKNEAILTDEDHCQPSIGYSKEDTMGICGEAGFKNIDIETLDVGAKDNAYWWLFVVAGKK